MVLALHSKMNFIKVFKMLLKRQYLYSSGWLILLHFFKKNLGRVPGVLFLLKFFTKILGRVPGVFSVFQCVQCVVSTDPADRVISTGR